MSAIHYSQMLCQLSYGEAIASCLLALETSTGPRIKYEVTNDVITRRAQTPSTPFSPTPSPRPLQGRPLRVGQPARPGAPSPRRPARAPPSPPPPQPGCGGAERRFGDAQPLIAAVLLPSPLPCRPSGPVYSACNTPSAKCAHGCRRPCPLAHNRLGVLGRKSVTARMANRRG